MGTKHLNLGICAAQCVENTPAETRYLCAAYAYLQIDDNCQRMRRVRSEIHVSMPAELGLTIRSIVENGLEENLRKSDTQSSTSHSTLSAYTVAQKRLLML